MSVIDLRSDTVTRPGQAMRAAMAAAEVGDDVYGEDPTVARLEASLAERAGMQAGLFVPSGTQSNLVALLTHCGRGDEYIVGQYAHTYKYEGGGAAALGGIQPQPIPWEKGVLDLDTVAAFIKADDPHFAKTRLLALENTAHGRVLPLDYLATAREFVNRHGLSLHLDGARVFNAAVALGVELEAITRHFDTVSICLSKGLGAPVGSVLCGPKDFIARARRWRKVTGGGMRQAGILAAAGLYALEHQVARLAEDHARASRLAEALGKLPGFDVVTESPRTNMLYLDLPAERAAALAQHLAGRGIKASAGSPMRLVTHRDIDEAAIDTVIDACRAFAEAGS